MPTVLLKLVYSQIMLKNCLVHRQNISFSMYAHALNEGSCVFIMFSCGEGFKVISLV